MLRVRNKLSQFPIVYRYICAKSLPQCYNIITKDNLADYEVANKEGLMPIMKRAQVVFQLFHPLLRLTSFILQLSLLPLWSSNKYDVREKRSSCYESKNCLLCDEMFATYLETTAVCTLRFVLWFPSGKSQRQHIVQLPVVGWDRTGLLPKKM